MGKEAVGYTESEDERVRWNMIVVFLLLILIVLLMQFLSAGEDIVRGIRLVLFVFVLLAIHKTYFRESSGVVQSIESRAKKQFTTVRYWAFKVSGMPVRALCTLRCCFLFCRRLTLKNYLKYNANMYGDF